MVYGIWYKLVITHFLRVGMTNTQPRAHFHIMHVQCMLCKVHALRSLKWSNTPSTRVNVHIVQQKWGQCSYVGRDLHFMHLRMRSTSVTIQLTSSTERPSWGMNIPQLADNLTDDFAPSDWSFVYSSFLWVLYYNVHVFTCVCTVSQAVCMCAWLIIIITRVTEA